MAAALGSLVVTLGLDAAKFTAGLSKAEYEAKKWRDTSIKAMSQFGAIVGTASVAAAVGLAKITKSAIDSADNLSKLSQKTGVATEQLSALQYAAELSGVAGDALSGGLNKLAKSMSEAAKGTGEQAEAFAALGIKTTAADGALRKTEDVLGDIATKFAAFKDGPEKAAIAMAIFGRSGADLIPLLNAGSKGFEAFKKEAEALGIVLSTQVGKDAEIFNDTLTKIGKVSDSLGLKIATNLLPSLQAVADEFVNMQKEGGGASVIVDGVRVAFETIVILGANVVYVLTAVGKEIGGIAAQVVALASLDIRGFRAISTAIKEDADRARKELDAFEARVMGGGKANASIAKGLGIESPLFDVQKPSAPRLKSSGAGGGAKKESEAERYLEGLRKQIEGLKTLSASEQALSDIQGKRIKDLTPSLQREILLRAKALDQARQLKADAESEQQSRVAASELSSRLYDARSGETLALIEGNAALRDEVEILRGGESARRAIESARISSAIAIKEEALAVAQLAGEDAANVALLKQQITLLKQRGVLLGDKQGLEVLKDQADLLKKQKTFAEEFGASFSSALEDAIVQGKSLRDVVKGLEQDILRIVTRKLVTEPLADYVTSLVGGKGGGSNGGGLAGIIGGLFGASGTNGGGEDTPLSGGGGWAGLVSSVIGAFAGGKAIGGMAEAGSIYRVAERRPEMLEVNGEQFLMMGSQRGRIDPNPAGGGKEVRISAPITINFPAGTSRQTANQAGGMVAHRLQRASQQVW